MSRAGSGRGGGSVGHWIGRGSCAAAALPRAQRKRTEDTDTKDTEARVIGRPCPTASASARGDSRDENTSWRRAARRQDVFSSRESPRADADAVGQGRPMTRASVSFVSVSSVLFLCALGRAAAAQLPRPIQWPTEPPPRPLPARDIKFPHYELQTLPNGLQVVAVLHHEQPVVSMRLLIRAGTAHDPKDKLGLAHLLSSLLDQGVAGSRPRTAAELNDGIDFIGGEMGAGAGTDWTMLNVTVMKDSFESGLQMLSDMSRYPAFAPNEIERQRQQMLSGLQVSLQDPEYVANSVFDRLVYGFHPYGMPDSGTPDRKS